MNKITSTTRFTCAGSKTSRPRIGDRSRLRMRKRESGGSFYGTRSITKYRPVKATKSSCVLGSAKPTVLSSNASPKSAARSTTNFFRRHVRFGYRSIRELENQRASLPKCAPDSRPEVLYFLIPNCLVHMFSLGCHLHILLGRSFEGRFDHAGGPKPARLFSRERDPSLNRYRPNSSNQT